MNSGPKHLTQIYPASEPPGEASAACLRRPACRTVPAPHRGVAAGDPNPLRYGTEEDRRIISELPTSPILPIWPLPWLGELSSSLDSYGRHLTQAWGVPLDALTVSILTGTLTALLNSTAGEAGKEAWKTLTTSTSKLLGGKSTAEQTSTALDRVASTTETAALPVAATLAAEQMIAAAEQIPEYAEFLRAWHLTAEQVITRTSSTTNIVTGNAQVKNLIQADNITTLNIGG